MTHYLKNLEHTVRDHWDQKALCDYEGQSFTYADVATNISKFGIFFSDAGIGKGDKIAICARNSARWAMTFWGINVNGRVTVPLLADFHPNNVTSLTNHSDCVVLFVDDDIWAKLKHDDLTHLKAAINVKDGQLLWHRDDAVAQAWENRQTAFERQFPDGLTPQQINFPDIQPDELAIINYTSGTTGNPKGVMLTYGAMSDTDDFANSHFPNHPGETVISMLPLAHMYGLAIEFIHPNVDGVTVYFLGKSPSPTTLLKAMQTVKPYMVVTVPLVMEKIYANSIKPALKKRRAFLAVPGVRCLVYAVAKEAIMKVFGGQVRCFIMGGAALNPEAERCFKKMRLPYTVGYGMTEACPLLGYEWWTRFVAGSCGKPVQSLERPLPRTRRNPGTRSQHHHRILQEPRSHRRGVHQRRMVPHGRPRRDGRRGEHLHPRTHQIDDSQLFRTKHLSRGTGSRPGQLPLCGRERRRRPGRENRRPGLSRDSRRHRPADTRRHPRTNPDRRQQRTSRLQQNRQGGTDGRPLRENPEDEHQTLPLQVTRAPGRQPLMAVA